MVSISLSGFRLVRVCNQWLVEFATGSAEFATAWLPPTIAVSASHEDVMRARPNGAYKYRVRLYQAYNVLGPSSGLALPARSTSPLDDFGPWIYLADYCHVMHMGELTEVPTISVNDNDMRAAASGRVTFMRTPYGIERVERGVLFEMR